MDRLHSMRAFVRVVEEGSFAAAARAMDVSPAVVTRLVADLESYLGACLMKRTTRKLSLTDAGRLYLERAVSILEELDETESAVRADVSKPRGMLRVISPTAFACHFLARHLPRFFEQFPDLRLSIVHGQPDTAEVDYDVSIIAGLGPLDGDFIAHPLGTVHGILCASPRYLEWAGIPMHPSELSRHTCAKLQSVHMASSWLLEKDNGENIEEIEVRAPQSLLRAGNAEIVLAAAVAGLGIALLPAYVPEESIRSGTLVKVLPGWRTKPITYHAAIPSRRYIPARTRVFLSFLRNIFNPAQPPLAETSPSQLVE
jgi:DNA-binding transcriptional LysR family regulator